ncbi:MAG: hypothetical protein H0U89_01810 [Acidimicrobiia bacterium]|nr:hypothetical protein [Acidimicrobiia bacterium]
MATQTAEDLERLRRSLAMLTPGQAAGLSREDAIGLLAELQQARRRLDRLEDGLGQLLEESRLGSGHPS